MTDGSRSGDGRALASMRSELVACARTLVARGLAHGSTGNVSVRADDLMLVTPTGSSLGSVTAHDLSTVGLDGRHRAGPQPSKEAFLHAAVYRARPDARAVLHTHSANAAAVSCLAGLDPDDALPPLTAYYVMRVRRLPLLPFHAPGDRALEALAEATARTTATMLLANHGPVVAAPTLAAGVDVLEEIEQTARLHLLLAGHDVRPLQPDEVRRLRGPGPANARPSAEQGIR